MSAPQEKQKLAISSAALSNESEDIRISVPWGHISCRWFGNRNVRPILALHGWLDNLGTWSTLLPLLPAHIGVFCIDFPGHGRSSKYPPGMIYHVLDYVNVIVRIMKEYGWRKVSLMGHSMGSAICFLYTALFPHTVDMLIGIDLIVFRALSPATEIAVMHGIVEKNLQEDERQSNLAMQEPPSYTEELLERVLYKGTRESIDLENTKYLLSRNRERSKKYPEKYYFSRDGKLKYYVQYIPTPELTEEMAKRIKNVPYLLLKGTRSQYLQLDRFENVFETLHKNNKYFEFYEIDGTHHLHLNNAEEVAAVIKPFIHRHRPVIFNKWSLNDENGFHEKPNKNKKTNNSSAAVAVAGTAGASSSSSSKKVFKNMKKSKL